MDGTFDDLHEPQMSDSIPEAEQLVAEHEEWKAGPLQDASAKYDELNGLVQQMADLGSTDNPYSAQTPEVSYLFLSTPLLPLPSPSSLSLPLLVFRVFMRSGVPCWRLSRRRTRLWLLRLRNNRVRHAHSPSDELVIILCVVSADNEQLRVAFAEKANQVGAYVEAKNAALTDLNIQNQGTLEEQLEALKAFQQEVASYEPEFEACEVANQDAQAALVFDNPHTSYSMDVSDGGGE